MYEYAQIYSEDVSPLYFRNFPYQIVIFVTISRRHLKIPHLTALTPKNKSPKSLTIDSALTTQ